MRFLIGDLVLDPEAYELRRDGEEVAAEPRVLDLVVYLVEHRDRVISKDELLREVWQGQHVGESALTRCVYEARRALGDDATRQELVKTVYGRGYQFVGPVNEERPERKSPETVRAGPDETRGSRWLGGSVVLSIVAAVGLLAHLTGADRDPGTIVEHPGAARLAVMPFSTSSDEPEAELTALSLTDQLWVRLGAVGHLVVRSPDYDTSAREVLADPARFAAQAGVDALLAGDLRETAARGRFEIEVTLYEIGPGDAIRSLPIGIYEIPALESRRDLTQFVRLREAIADDVVEHLAPTRRAPPIAGITPRNPEAFRLYLQARQRFYTISCGDAEALLDLLDRSLALDPEFALAWVAKGFALYSQTWACGRDATFADRALRAARRARELAPAFPQAVSLEALLLVEQGEVENAYELIVKSPSEVRRSPLASFARGYALRYAGFLGASRDALEETLAIDPLFLREFGYAPVTLLYRNELERFLELMPAADTPHDRYYRGWALARAGRIEEAAEVLEPSFRLNPTDLFGRFSSALLAILEGDEETGAEIVRGIVRQRDRLGTPDGEMTFKEAQLLAWAGAHEEALQRVETAVAAGFFCAPCIAAEPRFESLRSSPRFHAAVETARARHRSFADRFGLEEEP